MRVSSEAQREQKLQDGRRRQSSAESTSSSGADLHHKQQRKWYRRWNLNPLRLQKIPPVPAERSVSREHGASFLSLAYFQWMSPLMKVCFLSKKLVMPS
jgi:hypothetical protein